MAKQDPFERITPREREVLTLLRLGLTDGQIAERLAISQSGASYHVSQIIGKMGVRDRYEAAAWPDPPPWWVKAFAPLVLISRRMTAVVAPANGPLAMVLAAAVALVLVSAVGLMVALLVRANPRTGDSAPPAGAHTKPADSATFPARTGLFTTTPAPATDATTRQQVAETPTPARLGAIQGHVTSLDPQTELASALVLVIPVGLAQPVHLDRYAPGIDPERFMRLSSSREGLGLVAIDAKGAYSITGLSAGEYLAGTSADASLANALPMSEVIEISIDGLVSTMPAFRVRVGDAVTTVDFTYGTPRTGPSRIKFCVTAYLDPKVPVGVRHVITNIELRPAHPDISVALTGDGCVQLENIPAGHYSFSLTTAGGFISARDEIDIGPGEDYGQQTLSVHPPVP